MTRGTGLVVHFTDAETDVTAFGPVSPMPVKSTAFATQKAEKKDLANH